MQISYETHEMVQALLHTLGMAPGSAHPGSAVTFLWAATWPPEGFLKDFCFLNAEPAGKGVGRQSSRQPGLDICSSPHDGQNSPEERCDFPIWPQIGSLEAS